MSIDTMKRITPEEIKILDKATDDFFDVGHTDQVCPRCGNGYQFSNKDTSYQIKCKTKDCIQMTTRGI